MAGIIRFPAKINIIAENDVKITSRTFIKQNGGGSDQNPSMGLREE